jgi:hypothetical protein
MDEQHKLDLIESAKKLTLEGITCVIGGWQHDFVTLVPDFGGIWQTSWETLERAIQGDGNLTAADVKLYTWIWKGKGEQIPDPIKERFPPAIAEH